MSHQNAHCVAAVYASGFSSIFLILKFGDTASILGGKIISKNKSNRANIMP